MGLTSLQLIPTLFCLLACSGNVVRRRQCNITLPEIITTLNFLEKDKSPYTKLTIADVFDVPKNTSEMETLCRAATALRQFYSHHEKETCRNATVLQHGFLIKYLKGLDRNLYSMTDMKDCAVNEAKKRTLRNFLERLKMNMQKKISEWC
ncbi:PREDICTED: interleukin-4 [Galeopterus variegatus]|uniref:Interleukin-4 n=1 Tax=Galeopterus variegatus TaxID=482537 RepID=A0ABM0QND6_GALVR|nr:PREDICTED: interleukin-4 [Galeopterus variegatus]